MIEYINSSLKELFVQWGRVYALLIRTWCGISIEKISVFRNNVIPIVMGPSKDFYDSIAPPHSFIHVDQFASPRDLAK